MKKLKTWTTKNGINIKKVLEGRSNVFLISANDKRILVDTGPGRVWRTLNRRLVNLGIINIDYLVLTHAHFDHAGNAERIKRVYGAKVIINEYEASFLRKGTNSPTRGSNTVTGFILRLFCPVFSSVKFYRALEPDIITSKSFDFEIIKESVIIIHTPGHTPGSQSVIVDNEIAVVGDAMFGVFPGSVFPPFAFDAKELVGSWGKLLATKCSLYLPSHGSEDSIELVERDYNSRMHVTANDQ
ncbi:MAG: MBL fold metallo-hydrolase [Bacteroidales bacterium]